MGGFIRILQPVRIIILTLILGFIIFKFELSWSVFTNLVDSNRLNGIRIGGIIILTLTWRGINGFWARILIGRNRELSHFQNPVGSRNLNKWLVKYTPFTLWVLPILILVFGVLIILLELTGHPPAGPKLNSTFIILGLLIPAAIFIKWFPKYCFFDRKSYVTEARHKKSPCLANCETWSLHSH
jgi:hypothetical protein